MAYRYVAVSVAGFVQQLAVGYIARGYYFYVAGRIPENKDPARTDAKIMAQYGIGVSKWVRARRKKAGLANVHYLRYERFFVLIANHGEQPFHFTFNRLELHAHRHSKVPDCEAYKQWHLGAI